MSPKPARKIKALQITVNPGVNSDEIKAFITTLFRTTGAETSMMQDLLDADKIKVVSAPPCTIEDGWKPIQSVQVQLSSRLAPKDPDIIAFQRRLQIIPVRLIFGV